METEKAADILHTCLCLRGLSAGILNKSHPSPTWSGALGQLSLPTALAQIKHVGKTLWATVFSGVPKIPQSRKSWEGQEGKQLSLDQHEDACPIPTLCSAPHLHTDSHNAGTRSQKLL